MIRLGYAAREALSRGERSQARALPSRERATPPPASFAQEQFWFVDQVTPGNAAYIFSWPVRLRGPLDVSALERALAEVVARHEALRTGFALADGRPVQVVAAPGGFALEQTDVSRAGSPEAEALRLVTDESQRAFDLGGQRLFRARLVRLAEADHVLHVLVHHVVFDEWSKVVLFRELSALYASFAAGRVPILPPPAVQFGDYASEQRSRLDDAALADDLTYWSAELRGVPTALDLPTDRPRPATFGCRGARIRVPLPDGATAALDALARAEGASLFEGMLALFEVLLHRYTRQDDFVVGVPADLRTSPELDDAVGVLLNTVVLRSDVGGSPTFRELLQRIGRRVAEAAPHAELPFEALVRELQPVRDPSRHPVFQVLLAVNPPEPELELPGVEAEEIQPETASAQVDLFLFLQQREGGVDARWDFSADLFDEPTIERMHDHFVRLLEAAVAEPDVPADELPLLSPAERAELLLRRQGPEVAYTTASLHALVEAQVARTPDAVAVSDGARAWSYAELNASANRLARRLRGVGVGPESAVAVSLERSAELVVVALAVLKAGGAYVPLDPELPEERLAFMLEDSGAEVLVTTAELLPRLPAHGGTTIRLDADAAGIAGEAAENLGVQVEPEGLAYVIYTSGSTGRPKGVLNTHGAIVNRLLSMQDTYALDGSDRLLLKTQASFDVSIRELFWPLLFGARSVVVPAGEQGNPRFIVDLVEREQVTTLHFVPSMLQLFLEQADPARCRSVRCVLAGGEALPGDLARAFFERFDCELHNLYGPTEAAVSVTSWRCRREGEPAVVPIGRPVPNTQVYVLGPALQPVPDGLWGELFIGGAQVAHGYHARPELTEQLFVSNPFGAGRLYRTGDLVRWNADGALEFGGRVDDQVKVRGFRVELGEIEAVLREHEAVAKSAVIAVETAGGLRDLAAYVVPDAAPQSEQDGLVGSVLAFLRERLPDYMVPSTLTVLPELPLLPNGKLDRNALPSPERPVAADTYVEPQTDAERAVAAVWEELLGLERVGRDDNFFGLGGHSLLAARVIGRLAQDPGVEVELRTFLQEPTVAALAAALERPVERSQPELPPLVARSGLREASFAQERFWFVDEVMGRTAAYNIPLAIRLRGQLSVEALERALGEIVRRHEILRTRFAPEGERLLQVVDAPRAVAIPVVDLTGEADPDAAARVLVDTAAQTPLEPTTGPLFTARVLRLAEDDHVLDLVFSHLVFDGVSRVVLLRDLAALYAAYVEGTPPALGQPALQYGDYAEWQRSWLEGDLLERELAYWKEALDGMSSTLELPTDHARPPATTLRGAWTRSSIPAELVERVQALARREGASLYMTLLAAFDVLLSRYSGQEDIAVGMPVDSRDRPELEEAIGVFVDTVVLRVDVSGAPPFRELLGRVRASVLDAVAHQKLPFEQLVRALQPERDLSRHALYQVMLTLVPTETPPPFVGLELEEVPTERASSPIDLTVFLEEREGRLDTIWEYSTDLFDLETVTRMQGHFVQLLEAVVADPEQTVDALPISPEEERRALLAAWSRDTAEYPVACLNELFEARAAAAPDSPALTFEGQTLTYRELNERANRLAHRLRELGVGPDTMVALCLQRSLELVVAILAVLKAGGAYVPLDPEYPAERIEFALTDTAAPVLVTEQAQVAKLPRLAATVVCVDVPDDVERGTANPEPLAVPSNLAYVIYTSGSTGQPKGVQVEHRHVARLFTATDEWFRFGPDETWLLFHSYAFDFSVWELWGALLHGGRLVIPTFWTTRSPEGLAALLVEERVTFLNATPSLFVSVQDELLAVRDALALETVVFGGEALQPSALRPWFDTFGAAGPQLVNMYGITETTVHVTYRPIGAADCERSWSPIGRPIPDLQLYVLDGRQNPVPPGLPGELYVGGAGVARGYLNRPELTAERFIENPFGAGRLYRSGDGVRLRNDGELEFLGRLDDQVKIRGFRIELGEIQAALLAHDGVSGCAVVAVDAGPGEKRLAAYVVPADGSAGAALPGELRQHLEAWLPSYMVPAAIVPLAALPLTTNGKLDRRALPDPEWATEQVEEQFVAPRTPTEIQIAAIWCEILDVERVGADDNFFHLGGHSLLAARVVTRVREHFAIELSVRALFEHPTLSAFAEDIAGRSGAGESAASEPEDAGGERHWPPSFSQQQMLFIDELAPTVATYNGVVAVRINGELDRAVLEQALADAVERHEALRTVFRWEDDGPVQVVLEDRRLALETVDLGPVPADTRDADLQRLIREESRRPFDLGNDLMTRATLFVLGPQEHVLLCVTHHIASDGWSVGIFCRDVSELYTAHIEGREARLPDLPRQYRDFVSWQRERLTGAHLDAQLAYWRSQLAGAPTVLELPTPRARTPHQTFEGASLPVELPADLAAAVLARSREASVTPYMLLLAVFSLLLYRRTGQDDILVGSPFANRSRAEFEELVGFVANTLVLRVQLAGNPTFSTLLGRVRETTLGALDHQEVPFDHVVEAMRVQRRQDVNPLVQVNFRARVEEPATLQLPGATTSRVAVDAGFAAFELALDLHVLEEAIVGELLYNVELFDLPSAVRLADDYAALLGQVLKEPGSRLLDLEVPNESIPATDDAAPAAGSIRGFRKAADRDEAAAGESR